MAARRSFNSRSYTLVTAPSVEPVSLSDAKTFLRVDGTADDTLITLLIASARRACEEYTKRAFINQTWKLTMDRFTEGDGDTFTPGMSVGLSPCRADGSQYIQLSRQPISSIASIKSRNSANTQSTLAVAAYTLDAGSGRILLNSGYSWPSDLRGQSAVEVEFVAGYGAAAVNVPAPIQQAILLYVRAQYSDKCVDMPDGCKTLLDPFRLPEAFGAW